MRLLFISNVFPNPLEPTKGTFNRELVRALAAEHAVHVISPIAWLDEWRTSRQLGSTRHEFLNGVLVHYPRYYYTPKVFRGWYGWFMWRSIHRTIRDVVTSHRPQAVLSYWAHPDGEVAVRAAQLAGVPALVMVGGSDVLLLTQNPRRRRRILNVLRAADCVVTVSHDLRSTLNRSGVNPDKIHVVYRGVDLERFCPGDRDEARRKLGIPLDERMMLWVGRMVPVKGLDVLLDACSALKQRGVVCRLHLAGDGPLRKSLEGRAAACDVSCSFVGVVPHEKLADWYRAANVTVLPSRSEGVPNVLRESQACGTPFVASRVGGIPEIADSERDHLVPPCDAMSLADTLETVLFSAPGEQAKRVAPSSWSESAREISALLERLVALPSRSGGRPSVLRQFGRRALAATLPRRFFLVRGPETSKSVCLTFDDGPHPEHTPRLLDVLKRHRLHATFFIVGKQAEQHPELVRRIADEGHTIGHHSYTHSDPRRTTAADLLAEVRRTQELFSRTLGWTSTLFRPPWGKLTVGKFWKLTRAGYKVVLWNLDPKDYACKSANEVRAWFAQQALQGGDVVLMHDTHAYAAEVVPELADAASQRGLAFTTVDHWVR